jgi:ABC-type amino acid transport substrate-binding protein
MNKLFCLIALFVFIAPLYAEMTPNDISYYTEDYPPYNFKKNGIASGFATEILLKMFEKLNVNKTVNDIRVVPWARGYNDVQKKSNVCLFTMTKTPERVKEHGFRWVGPVTSTGSVLFARKSKNLKINSVEDMQKYRVCAIRDDVAEQIVVKLGYSMDNVDRTSNPVSIIKKLNKDRCTLWAYGIVAGQWVLKKNNFKTEDYEIVYNLTKKQYLYYAFNKRTPDSVVKPLQKAFDELKAEGVVDQIISQYLK